MGFWAWDASLNVGITIIDEQHKRIVDYLNVLHDAISHKNREQVSEVIAGLINYTDSHFSFEESLMDKAGYPLSDAHKMVHKTFIKQMNSYKTKHNEGNDISRELMSNLQIWLTNHIKKEDKDYVTYVNKFLKRESSWLKKTLNRFF